MMSQQWFFDWDNARVHTADFVLLKKNKMGAGRPEPRPGQLQERLGGGHDTSDHRRLRLRLQKLGGALQKVRPPRRQVRRKILGNKHPPSSNRCQFIDRFATLLNAT
jgi:hypothetical protein